MCLSRNRKLRDVNGISPVLLCFDGACLHLAAGSLVWNLATVGMSLSSGFVGILVSRIFMGIGQSTTSPASYSLIADYFEESMRGRANGIFSIGVYLGGGLSSLSITFAETIGWRATCVFVAGIGLAIAILVIISLSEPDRYINKSSNEDQRDVHNRQM